MLLANAGAVVALLLGATAGSPVEGDRVYVGKLVEVSGDDMQIGTKDSLIMIGFFGEPQVLGQLAGVRAGDDVRVVFGVGTPPGEVRPINKLLQIRRCAKHDRECAADRAAQEAQEAIEAKARAASQARHAQCRGVMDETLLKDARYVAPVGSYGSVPDQILKQLNSFTGDQRRCSNEILDAHRAAVFEACKLHHCGQAIGGGCAHIAGRGGMTTEALVRAAKVCGGKAMSPNNSFKVTPDGAPQLNR
jgi:hypothetical protein